MKTLDKGDIMKNEKRSHKEILKGIIEIEYDMFQQIKTAEPSECQDQTKTFRLMREMTHSVLSTPTLESYLEDLQKAKTKDRNLLTEKYARMDNLIPPLKTNPLINDIVEIEVRWIKELSEKYPLTFKGKSLAPKMYLFSELETYSDRTLELYFRDVSKAKKEGENLAEKRYTMLFNKTGYGSIAEAEKKAKTQKDS